jgi:hypothetical protein
LLALRVLSKGASSQAHHRQAHQLEAVPAKLLEVPGAPATLAHHRDDGGSRSQLLQRRDVAIRGQIKINNNFKQTPMTNKNEIFESMMQPTKSTLIQRLFLTLFVLIAATYLGISDGSFLFGASFVPFFFLLVLIVKFASRENSSYFVGRYIILFFSHGDWLYVSYKRKPAFFTVGRLVICDTKVFHDIVTKYYEKKEAQAQAETLKHQEACS